MSRVPYSSNVGCLMYAMMCNRPDICYAISLVSKSQSNPGRDHWEAVNRIFRYPKETTDHTLQPTPMTVSSSTNGADTLFADITHFHSLIGALQYLAITRPDIQFVVNRVAQHMHQPSEHDYHCLKRILRYICGSLGHGLLIRPGDLELRGFSDSDWANDKNDRKSTSGFLVFLGPNLISWCIKKQPKVSRSSTEVEYRTLALLAAETMIGVANE
uniref:Reverse transcriptase Ty1/copia-type domain-containing protein n=1 Tax=Solanum lycopersicum TaxID=4081 RepID=A0A3Q7GIG1_SOLLC